MSSLSQPDKVAAAATKLSEFVESLGPPILHRKLVGICNALLMQVEDGRYEPEAVALLCDALVAATGVYRIPEDKVGRIREMAGAVAVLAGKRG